MKVSREARVAFEEWNAQAAQVAAEEAAESEEIDRIGNETLERDYARETQSIRDEISRKAGSEHWDADQWLKAMKETYRFTDEELVAEYQSRLLDDLEYTDALYEMHEFPYLVNSRRFPRLPSTN